MHETQGIEEKIEELAGLVERYERIGGNRSASKSNINVNAGGVAVWIAATACIVMLVATIVAAAFVGFLYVNLNSQMIASVSDLNRQTKDLRDADVLTQAYITAGYTSNPKEEEVEH